MFSTPLTSCSIGVATVSAITFGFAPGYVALTTTVGGTTSGYWATGSLNRASPPTRTITIDNTEAKIGRSIKKWENFMTNWMEFAPERAVGLWVGRGW